MENLKLAEIRKDYLKGELDEKSVDKNPLIQFSLWMNDALKAEVMEPTAMVLATVGKNFKPSARIVLLKGVDDGDFVFFSNYESKKGLQIDENPHVALTFFWKELERQVRIEGEVEKTSQAISENYFHSRPYESRLSAAASPQSNAVRDRQELERLKAELREQFPDNNFPRPANWGGFRVKPRLIEFWQGRRSRLHDRVVYELNSQGVWLISRLAP